MFPLICLKRAAVSLYCAWLPLYDGLECLKLKPRHRKGGLMGVPDTQYPTRCRLSLKKKITIGLDTKICAVFVLISLVTQGAFESTREKES